MKVDRFLGGALHPGPFADYKRDPSRNPPRPPAPTTIPPVLFSAKTLWFASQRPDPFPPRHRTRLLSLYKLEVRFSARWLQSITKTALRGPGSFVPLLLVVLSAKVVPPVPPGARRTAPSASVSLLLRELIGDRCSGVLDWKLKIVESLKGRL